MMSASGCGEIPPNIHRQLDGSTVATVTKDLALEQALALSPDIIVMDISMPGTNGLVATRTLREQRPDVAVVILTRHSDDAYLEELLRAGAAAYVLKQSPPTELLQAIRAVARGRQYVDSSLTGRLTASFLERDGGKAASGAPSERENEVLRLVAAGYSNKEIAAQLDLSVKTVETHKANAMRKLGLTGRIDIVRYALLQGWMGAT